jgi:hypothetical protein
MKTRSTKTRLCTKRASFRLEIEYLDRIAKLALKNDASDSWVIRKCLKIALPKLEETTSFSLADLQSDSIELTA